MKWGDVSVKRLNESLRLIRNYIIYMFLFLKKLFQNVTVEVSCHHEDFGVFAMNVIGTLIAGD